MSDSELCRALARIIQHGVCDDLKSADIACAALAYIRQHDESADLRERLAKAETEIILARLETIKARELVKNWCHETSAELGKEQNNG